jgi:hypothetical protein
MEPVCHRCGGTLNLSDPFCPHCGAPQLRYESLDEPAPSSGASPSQRLAARNFNAIAWRDAILGAAIIAVPAGMLSSLFGLEALWGIAGGIIVISLYRRRTGTFPTSKMGWRIGALLGVFAAFITAVLSGLALVIQRYAFHQGAVIDQRLRDAVQLSSEMYTNLFAGSNPDMVAAFAEMRRFWLTPDGAATMVLLNTVGVAIFLLLFAAVGGAIGARLSQKTAQSSAR